MEAVIIVTALALLQYMYFGFQVGGARGKSGVSAPATSGDEYFECINRVHQNTLEQLIILLPAMWMFAHYVNPLWGAGMGVVYLIGRAIYCIPYRKDPKSRGLGFTLSFLPGVVMTVWVMVVAAMSYL